MKIHHEDVGVRKVIHRYRIYLWWYSWMILSHYNGVIMSAMASQITSLTSVYSTVFSGSDEIKHQSSASLAFVRGIHRSPVNSPHKWPVTRKMFPFDDVIMLPCSSKKRVLPADPNEDVDVSLERQRVVSGESRTEDVVTLFNLNKVGYNI